MVRWKADPGAGLAPSSFQAKPRSLTIRYRTNIPLIYRQGDKSFPLRKGDTKKSSKEQNSPKPLLDSESNVVLLCFAMQLSPYQRKLTPLIAWMALYPPIGPASIQMRRYRPPKATRSGSRAMQTEVQQRSVVRQKTERPGPLSPMEDFLEWHYSCRL